MMVRLVVVGPDNAGESVSAAVECNGEARRKPAANAALKTRALTEKVQR